MKIMHINTQIIKASVQIVNRNMENETRDVHNREIQ